MVDEPTNLDELDESPQWLEPRRNFNIVELAKYTSVPATYRAVIEFKGGSKVTVDFDSIEQLNSPTKFKNRVDDVSNERPTRMKQADWDVYLDRIWKAIINKDPGSESNDEEYIWELLMRTLDSDPVTTTDFNEILRFGWIFKDEEFRMVSGIIYTKLVNQYFHGKPFDRRLWNKTLRDHGGQNGRQSITYGEGNSKRRRRIRYWSFPKEIVEPYLLPPIDDDEN